VCCLSAPSARLRARAGTTRRRQSPLSCVDWMCGTDALLLWLCERFVGALHLIPTSRFIISFLDVMAKWMSTPPPPHPLAALAHTAQHTPIHPPHEHNDSRILAHLRNASARTHPVTRAQLAHTIHRRSHRCTLSSEKSTHSLTRSQRTTHTNAHGTSPHLTRITMYPPHIAHTYPHARTPPSTHHTATCLSGGVSLFH
jgi:hypothetical protein